MSFKAHSNKDVATGHKSHYNVTFTVEKAKG